MTTLPYADAGNPDLLDRMPLDARSVLDVGCGAGALGADYKRRNPAALYHGIDIDPASARVAVGRIDEVATVDVEAEPLPFGQREYDCIVYGDVLEHLRDPWSLLARHAQALSDTGTVLICMPNVEHWSFAERLLRGTWDYEQQGLFDATHLRWFSLETTRRALAAAGLEPYDVTPRIFDARAAQQFARLVLPALEALGIDAANYLGRAAPLQYVWRAARRRPQQMHVVSTMLAPVGGVSHVRVVEPVRAIATDASITTSIIEGWEAPDLPRSDPPGEDPRIFVIHRPAFTGAEGLGPVRRALARGYLVVCEFDDHPDYIPVLQRPDVQNFRAVHAIQTTTEPLAEVLRRENPEIKVFPNAISRLPAVRNYADPGRLTLFFAGLNREEEWPPFLPALNAVAAIAGERLQFQIVADRGLFDALATPHKSFTPLCDYGTYLDLLGQCEISFMPLQDNIFNRCKSDLKFLEAAAARVTALASPVPYGVSIEDGRTGLLFRDPRELQQRLMRLVANPDLGQAIGDAARLYVGRQRMLAYQVGQRIAWYRSLWERREELRHTLLARVPELAG